MSLATGMSLQCTSIHSHSTAEICNVILGNWKQHPISEVRIGLLDNGSSPMLYHMLLCKPVIIDQISHSRVQGPN